MQATHPLLFNQLQGQIIHQISHFNQFIVKKESEYIKDLTNLINCADSALIISKIFESLSSTGMRSIEGSNEGSTGPF